MDWSSDTVPTPPITYDAVHPHQRAPQSPQHSSHCEDEQEPFRNQLRSGPVGGDQFPGIENATHENRPGHQDRGSRDQRQHERAKRVPVPPTGHLVSGGHQLLYPSGLGLLPVVHRLLGLVDDGVGHRTDLLRGSGPHTIDSTGGLLGGVGGFPGVGGRLLTGRSNALRLGAEGFRG